MKKKDRRLLQQSGNLRKIRDYDLRSVIGGVLVQDPDQHRIYPDQLNVVTRRKPTDEEMLAMLFAWKVAKHVKSNAIVYARGDRTLGIGAGQMSRVDSSRIAALKARDAGLDLRGCAVASDAFFPFADGLLEAVKVGATAVIQPGGSVRDQEVINAADEHSVAMVFTGIRHFRH
jgi:phosphoribosylaminoimidazolecarboxamide formyltransferase/IMP cyclohydrolase